MFADLFTDVGRRSVPPMIAWSDTAMFCTRSASARRFPLSLAGGTLPKRGHTPNASECLGRAKRIEGCWQSVLTTHAPAVAVPAKAASLSGSAVLPSATPFTTREHHRSS